MTLTARAEVNPGLLDAIQPRSLLGRPPAPGTGSFSSHVTFSSPTKADPRVGSGVTFASVFGTATPAGPITSAVNFGSRFSAQGNDLASGRYRR